MSETSKSKTDIFKERIEAYPDIETAKKHFAEIAKELQCSPSLGYKALKTSKFMKEAPSIPTPEVPTVRIPETAPAEIALPPEPERPEEYEEKPTFEAEAEAPKAPTPAIPTEKSEIMLKCEPILERSVGRLFNLTIEISSGMKEALTKEEQEDTAILLPILVWRITRVTLTEDQFIDMTCVTHFGSIVLKVINQKVQEWRQRRQREQEAPVKATPTEQPKEEPKQETGPKQTETPKTQTRLTEENKKPTTAPFLDKL